MFTVTCFNLIATALMAFGVTARPNFLLIVVDDLRTTLGCYGDVNAYTPHIDALAKDGVLFNEAFAQQALCAPSRNSFLTSRRPDTLRLYDFYSYWRDTVGNYTTLPEHLRNNGYSTMSVGKVFHPGVSSNGSDDSPYSWTEKPFHPYTDRYKNAPVCKTNPQSEAATNLMCPVHISNMPNETLPDIETLQKAREFIRKHNKDSNPFFLAVGFQKPHVPLKYPERYLKYHPIRKFKMPEPYRWPDNVSEVAYNPWTDLRWRRDVANLRLKFPWERIPEQFGKLIVQSYYAAVSYIDNMIGKLVHQLHLSMIRENTVVILTSDHGWALGEHATWSKFSNFDVAVHVPLIISIPTLTFDINRTTKRNANHMTLDSEENDIILENINEYKESILETYVQQKCDKSQSLRWGTCRTTNAIAELVDVFPTIADLAGVPIPLCQTSNVNNKYHRSRDDDFAYHKKTPDLCSEGITLLPLIKNIVRCQSIPWKKAAFSQYPRPGIQPTLHPNSDKPRLKEINVMGYTLKTSKYRYTMWVPFAHNTCKPNWNVTIAEELYDHRTDRAENFNVADLPNMSKAKKYLRILLQNGWRSALPRY
ncbi:iduronate 2-sulfatase isoform X2 [Pseudomyrmex gracilis]|uniref:iduronate 2-sulfatase isoform X2 n=1 Tax=Pseudomyrmex gracilis TaxID=219809 RepID=UPI00099573D1|nr:iduronate 2-sulfatase isoform X2 [Pseudomyrmex gracilis]